MSIRAKLTVAVAACMLTFAAAAGLLVRATQQRAIRIAAEQAVAAAGASFAALERADEEKLDATLRVLGTDGVLVAAFAARDRARLQAVAAPILDVLRRDHGISHLTFLEPAPSRRVFLRVHRPDDFGDVVQRTTFSRAIDGWSVAAGKEFGRADFDLRVIRSWHGRDGALVGFVELAEDMDLFVARLKQQTGDDYGLMVEKAFIDRAAWTRARAGKRESWDDRARVVVVNATVADDRELVFDGDLSSVPDAGLFLKEDEHGDRVFVHGIVPVKDAAGRRVGGLLVLHDVTALRENMVAGRRPLRIALAALTVGLTLVVVTLVNRVVLRRLRRMESELEVLAGRFTAGDLDVRVPRAVRDDEVGRFEGALGAFVERVVALLREAARGKGRGAGGGGV